MRRRQFGLGLAALAASARQARGTDDFLVRIARRNAFSELPLMVMQANRLIESHAAKLGLLSLEVEWRISRGSEATIDDLFANRIDFGVLDAPELVDLWDRTMTSTGVMRALSCVALQPFLLLTRNPAVQSLADFTPKDSIAVSRVRLSTPAVCLEMAAARQWGPGLYSRLDPLTFSLPDRQAEESLLAARPPVNTHYAPAPYYYDELATRGIHLVVKSNDTLGGPHANGLLVAAPYFDPGTTAVAQAVLAAQEEANLLIRQQPVAAARTYLLLTGDNRRPDDLVGMIGDPDIAWTTVPQRLMEFASFMHKVGRLEHMPASWKDLMLPEGRSGNGS
ncbi:MAG TPA: hypothetical protein VFN42_06040 [Acetobacteraceae bacterium]|nr:hypothetical protein [Acetobacteraceae bacterium]